MDKYVTQVKRHKHKNKYQYLITFTGDHGFEYGESVIVIKESDFNKFENEFTSLSGHGTLHKEELETLENERDEFKDRAVKSEGKVKELEGELSGLRDRIITYEALELEDYKTKYEDLLEDHLSQGKKLSETQENLSKAFGTLAIKEKLNTYYKTRPRTHSLFGYKPKDVKELEASEDVYVISREDPGNDKGNPRH
jgi:chromosome segregation ATPase